MSKILYQHGIDDKDDDLTPLISTSSPSGKILFISLKNFTLQSFVQLPKLSVKCKCILISILIFVIFVTISTLVTICVLNQRKFHKLPEQIHCGKPVIQPNIFETNQSRYTRIINGRESKPHSWP